jgi:uncharacterized protein
MKKSFFTALISLCLAVSIAHGGDSPPSAPVSAGQLATRFISLLSEGKFEKATEDFDANMKSAIYPHKLKEIWTDQLARFGVWRGVVSTRTEFVHQYRRVVVACRFEKDQIDVQVVIDESNRIAGLFFAPGQGARYRQPAYAKPALFKEKDVVVSAGEWALPGTLSMPVGKGPFPALVLVHGSGPHDRDESIGPNKPFRDLAWGLASRGIAVLRYEKRTRHYVAGMASLQKLTVKEETIEDALQGLNPTTTSIS